MEMEKEISEMKQKCKKRVQILSGLTIICCLLIATQVFNRIKPFAMVEEHFADMLAGFRSGLIGGLAGIAIFDLIRNARAAMNSGIARKMYIKENDERLKTIEEKSGTRFYIINVVCLTLGAVVSGYFNHIAFFTLICAVYFQILIITALKIYWTIKL